MDWKHEAQVKQQEREAFDSDTVRELTRVKALTEFMEKQCETLEQMQKQTND